MTDLLVPAVRKGPGVLVAHPWWGLNQAVRDYGAALAREGFPVGLADVFDGRVVTSIDDAQRQIETYWERAGGRLSAAISELAEKTGGPIGGVGFSFGGFHLLRLLDAKLPLRRVVAYYATHPLPTVHVPVLAHFAADDPYESANDMAALADALHKAGRPSASFTYPGTRHWFAEPDRPEYDAAAAALAFGRTIAFLRD
ncbi:MAG TPA: dienelactone hydrolase family protein [Devosia sp.]|nr:dienelactone hydrolase family protein [Devosia sp.]